jgi:predicted nucleotide-binding protein
MRLAVTFNAPDTTVRVKADARHEIETVFNIFEQQLGSSRLPVSEKKRPKPVIFIEHGRSNIWRDLKDHLQDKHGYQVEAYEVSSRAGHTIRDILEEMLEESSCAFLVLTGEDETSDGKLLARQNVVHETGLFQGRLGFSRAIVLLEEGTEEFSNIAGIQQIRFSKGNIKETFGEVSAVLRREFGT